MRRLTTIAYLIFCMACAPFPDLPTILEETLPSEEEKSQEEGETSETVDVSSAEDAAPAPSLPEPSQLVVNEIYYDAPASDTDGELFVELYGTPETSIGEYQVRFVNGSDGKVSEVIELPERALINSDGYFVIADGRTGALDTTQVELFDWLDNFDPQNGPDGIQVLSRQGALLDSVVYGEGAITFSDDGLPLGEGAAAPDVTGGHSLSRFPAGADTDDNGSDFFENTAPSPGTGELADFIDPLL